MSIQKHISRLILTAICITAYALPLSAPARAQDITSGLVGYWKLDETTGTTAADSSGNNLDGTMLNGLNASTNSISGQIGQALDFDGDDDSIDYTLNSTLQNLDDITFSQWIFWDGVAGNFQGIIDIDGILQLGFGFQNTDIFIGAEAWSTNKGSWLLGGGVIPVGQWTHVTLTYSYNDPAGTAPKLYINGVLMTPTQTIAPSGTFTSSTDTSGRIGSFDLSGQRELNGALDDVRIYDRVLSEEDITELYERTRICAEDIDAGKLIYNENYRAMQYCNGDDWQSIGKGASIIHGEKSRGEDYNINAVEFDGAGTFLSTNSFTAPVDSKKVTFSLWFKSNADGTEDTIVGTNGAFDVRKDTTNQIRFRLRNASPTQILDASSPANSLDAEDGWVHILASFDLSNPTARHIFINDVDVSPSGSNTDDIIDFSSLTTFNIGDASALNEWADLWADFGTYIDLSIEANRRKFTNADGQAINLGTDGSGPTGSAPDIFLSGDTDDWHTNKGTGGGFTENGALTDATTVPPSESAQKLIGWWRLDETEGTTFTDSSDNANDGTATFITLPGASSIGPIGTSINFTENGQSRITTSSTSDFTQSNSFTYSAWINPSEIDGILGIINIPGVLTMNSRFNGQRIQINPALWDTSGSYSTDADFPLNSWTHVAMTYSYDDPVNTFPKIYFNGVEVSVSRNVVSSGNFLGMPSSASVRIGSRGTSNGNFHGAIDDARIYNFALDADQIAELYAASNIIAPYLPNAVNFAGTAPQRIREGFTGPSNGTEFTGSFWIRNTSGLINSTKQIMSSNGQINNISINTNGDMIFRFRDSAATTDLIRITADTNIAPFTWHHIMYSFDVTNAANRFVYIDDTPAALTITDWNNGLISFNPLNFTLFGERNGDNPINADISDFWFDYNTFIDLSVEANRRTFIDATGLPVDLGSDGSTPTGSAPDIYLGSTAASFKTNLGSGGGFSLKDGTLTDVDSSVGDGLFPRYCANPTNAEGTLIYNTDENVMQYCDGYTYRPLGPQGDGGGGCSNPSGVAGMMFYNEDFKSLIYCEGDEWIGVGRDPTNDLLADGLVGHWKLDETSGTIAADSSGNGFDGTMISITGASNTVSGIIDTAIDFEGPSSGDAISMGDVLALSNSSLTLSAWFNKDNLNTSPSGGQQLISRRDQSGGPNYFGDYILSINDNGSLNFSRYNSGWEATGADATQNITTGTWQHAVATFDNNTLTAKLYLDGVEVDSDVFTAPIGANTGTMLLQIGEGGDQNSWSFEGAIDDVRIYNRALGAGEIQSLYNLADCPKTGDICRDGSQFVGYRDYGDGDVKLYTTPTELTSSIRWKTSGTPDADHITVDSDDDGKINAANLISDISNFPAIEECNTLTEHGKTDWYLPAHNELTFLVAQLSLDSQTRWSSTESSIENARVRSANAFTADKDSSTPNARCIRRD